MERRTDEPLLLRSAIKVTRTVWLLMLASIPVLTATAEISAPLSRHPAKSFSEAMAGLAMLCVLGWGVFRRSYVGKGRRQLAQDSKDAAALRRWRVGQIISFAMSEAVALYGLNLRYAGFDFRDVVPFYAAGMLLMLFSVPRQPLKRLADA